MSQKGNGLQSRHRQVKSVTFNGLPGDIQMQERLAQDLKVKYHKEFATFLGRANRISQKVQNPQEMS
jgi:hypothetical protein